MTWGEQRRVGPGGESGRAPVERRRVLVVEDEPAIAGLQRSYLERDGFGVVHVASGRGALDELRRRPADAVLLDVGLPDLSGIEVCRQMRERGDWTPVLFVTARDDEVDRVVGLELGADDYVTKPFSPRELVARVRAVLRRSDTGGLAPDTAPHEPARDVVTSGALSVDLACRRVRVHGEERQLTTTEHDLLVHLLLARGRVCSREELLAQVWGYPAGTATRTVDVHVAQLRSKLGDAVAFRSVRGVGYALDPPEAAPPGSGGGP